MKQDLLEKLQKQIQDRSCNTLSRIYPFQLQEMLDTSNEELKKLIIQLLDEGLMECKYDFQCSCGNSCTAYYQSIKIKGYQCDECEKMYDMSEILNKGSLLYELDKQALLDFGKEKINFKSMVNTGKIVKIPVKREEENEMKRKTIFLGSSSEAVNIMEDIAYQLQRLHCSTILWNDAGKNVFPAGHSIIDSLIQLTKRVDAAVLIFNEDDIKWNEKSLLGYESSVRDNVLLEYGLFAGVLGKEKVCIICKGEPHIPTDLLGVKYINGEDEDMIIKKQLEDWLNAM